MNSFIKNKYLLTTLFILIMLVLSMTKISALNTSIYVQIPTLKVVNNNTVSDNNEIVFELISETENAPMPIDQFNKTLQYIKVFGEGRANFGNIEFSEVGKYVYTIRECESNSKQYICELTEYTVTIFIEKINDKMNATVTLMKNYDEEKCDEMVFGRMMNFPIEEPVIETTENKTVETTNKITSMNRPITGDHSGLFLASVLLFLSTAVLIFLTEKDNKEKN